MCRVVFRHTFSREIGGRAASSLLDSSPYPRRHLRCRHFLPRGAGRILTSDEMRRISLRVSKYCPNRASPGGGSTPKGHCQQASPRSDYRNAAANRAAAAPMSPTSTTSNGQSTACSTAIWPRVSHHSGNSMVATNSPPPVMANGVKLVSSAHGQWLHRRRSWFRHHIVLATQDQTVS